MKSIADGLVPADENDRSVPYFHWWPKQGTTEWITYTFTEPQQVQSATIYWYDDQLGTLNTKTRKASGSRWQMPTAIPSRRDSPAPYTLRP